MPLDSEPDDFLDSATLAQILAQSDQALARDILDALRKDLAALLPALQGDLHGQRHALHNLAALAGTVGAQGLSAAAKAASATLKSGTTARKGADLQHLIACTKRLIDRLACPPEVQRDAG